MLKTSDFVVELLGVVPFLHDGDLSISPQEITSLSALLTFKGTPVIDMYKDFLHAEKNIDERIETILKKSALRGHASMGTTPVIALSFKGSKFLDSMLSGLIFSSSLMASGRRTGIDEDMIVCPSSIEKKRRSLNIYRDQSVKNIKVVNRLLERGVRKDEASKLLQYGIFGTGIMTLSVESLVSFKSQFEDERDWMPEEAGIFLEKVESSLKETGVEKIYASRESAPKNSYVFPNIFKDPDRSNMVRFLAGKHLGSGLASKVLDVSVTDCPEMHKRLKELNKFRTKVFKSSDSLRKSWRKLQGLYRNIERDFGTCLKVDVVSSVPWRVWGEKKRHRTVPMVSESIYYCIDRVVEGIRDFKESISSKTLAPDEISRLRTYFSIPPAIRKSKESLYEYLDCIVDSFEVYRRLVEDGIPPGDAIFVVPRAIKIDVFQSYNLFNLIDGYYPLRLCSSAEEQMLRNSLIEADQIKKLLLKLKLTDLADLIGPKCGCIGFCPEEESCGRINKYVKFYDQSIHTVLKEDLVREYKKRLGMIS